MLEVNDWVQRARSTPIEAVILARGIRLRRVGAERIGPCPKCGGTDRFSINVREGVWNCRGCKPDEISGDVIGLVEWLDDCGFEQACETLTKESKPNGYDRSNVHRLRREVAWFWYEDEDGEREFQVVKYEPKDFRPRFLDEKGQWVYGKKGRREIPYHLPEVIDAIAHERIVYIVEGEKDAETLRKLGIVATTNAGGCNGWKPELNEFFKDAIVVIIGDHDPQTINKKTGEKLYHPDGRPKYPGWDHAMRVAAELEPIAHSVRMFDAGSLYGLRCPDKCDVTDWIESGGGTREALDAFVDACPYWKPDIEPPPAQPLAIELVLPVERKEEEMISTRNWGVPGLLLRGHVTVIVAPSGSGKSLLTLQIGIACAVGKPWANWRPRKALRVLVINSEDDIDEIQRRLVAATYRMEPVLNGDPDSYIPNFRMLDATRASAVIAEFDIRKKKLAATPRFKEIVQIIKEGNFDVVFVDPFAETFDLDENSNNELKQAGMMWRDVARQTNAAICLIHHTKKYSSGMAGDVDAARGASALIGIARIVSTVFPMTVKEAEVMLGQEKKAERGRYLRYDDAKANLNIISPYAKWFRKDTITLNNGNGEIPGDDVGVLVPWEPKGLDVHEAQIIAFFTRVDQGIVDDDGKPTGEFYTFEKARANERYIGFFAQDFFKKDGEQLPLKTAEELIEGWKKSKRLRNGPMYKTTGRKMRKRVISELNPLARKADAEAAAEQAQETFF